MANRRTPQEQADDFVVANRKSPVISGYAIEPGNSLGKGVFYRLADGRRFRLGVAACRLLPDDFPRWQL